MESRVELFAQIRRDARVEGLSVRALAARHRVHRRTVRQALESASPPERKPRQGVAWRLEPFKPAIDAMLTEDTTAPRKQRHTARRILARLIEERGAEELSYSTVRDYVRVRRAQIDVEAGRRVEVFVPQEHAPGAEAEVDFGEVWVVLNGVKTKCHMFVFRLSHSGKAIHRIYPTQAQEAFLEGHIAAFQVLGGIPTKHIRYDNLTSAVSAVVFGQGRQRQENDRWVLFRSHYGFDPFYCQPGIAGAHEKGGVEGEVGWFRRNRLSPMPVASSLDELNDRIREWESLDGRRRINDRIHTIGQDFETEQPFLAPLPGEVFDPGLALTPRVDRSSMITVRMVKYSVPARFIGRKVRVSLRASEVVVFDGRAVAARHQRIVAKHGQSVQLDHYLEVLKTKPGALPGSTALARARESGAFTSAHEAFWAASRRVNGDAVGTRELIGVLLLHRSMDASAVTAGITAALGVGAVSADVVAVEARRHATISSGGGSGPDRHPGAHVEVNVQRVVSLTQRRLMDPAAVIAGLPPDTRPMPSISAYDELLAKRTHTEGTVSKENIS
ncbi:IS21 family transposase [Arthrobacter sp. KFRI-F3372]|uniref:IS21 family transposase n=1 Tax=Arthrobacter nitrophenolicus TaxID=683150 RepID=A0A4R5XL94_9MICC|nr:MULTISPECIES: IS21 family transposase [Micrococcaceae]MEE2523885.1 IS21 family transposase [Pseudarthrobacter sp. J47]MEE2530315.1 IS21 family transposase [Pseudarthrobacter sp. J75]TDL32113.1 IS21 family transposase [Arthrobacter nitrophenolicus]WHP61052.1 IS21 family transposase [Arthrobacter sp. KFRI-F3372]